MTATANAAWQVLVAHVSHVRVELRTNLEEVARGLRAVWGQASQPVVASERSVTLSAEASAGGYTIAVDGRVEQTTSELQDVLPLTERALYQHVRAWHAERALVHAACVRRDNRTLLLLGASGAGKSTLARACVRRGFAYGSDELTVCDGARVWGIPRAVQFDAIPGDTPPPTWLADCDLAAYRIRAFAERGGVVPLWHVAAQQLMQQPADLNEVRLVTISRGASDALGQFDKLHALQSLYEARLAGRTGLLAELSAAPTSYALQWNDPATAAALLEQLL